MYIVELEWHAVYIICALPRCCRRAHAWQRARRGPAGQPCLLGCSSPSLLLSVRPPRPPGLLFCHLPVDVANADGPSVVELLLVFFKHVYYILCIDRTLTNQSKTASTLHAVWVKLGGVYGIAACERAPSSINRALRASCMEAGRA